MNRLRNWWRKRGHNARDINCIYWTTNDHGAGFCGPCWKSGGYIAKRRAEIDSAQITRDVTPPTSSLDEMLADPDHPAWQTSDETARKMCATHQVASPTSQPCAACTEQAIRGSIGGGA